MHALRLYRIDDSQIELLVLLYHIFLSRIISLLIGHAVNQEAVSPALFTAVWQTWLSQYGPFMELILPH